METGKFCNLYNEQCVLKFSCYAYFVNQCQHYQSVVFIYNFFMLGDRGITASVSLSLFAVVMFASIFGTLVPMTLDKMKIDPALATGPFITITNDIIGMMIYMFITSALA